MGLGGRNAGFDAERMIMRLEPDGLVASWPECACAALVMLSRFDKCAL
jgi:hypothetical protein